MKSVMNYADAFDELENPIRDLERQGMIAFEKAMAVDHADTETELALFTTQRLFEMIKDLRQQYYRLAADCRGDRSTVVPLLRG